MLLMHCAILLLAPLSLAPTALALKPVIAANTVPISTGVIPVKILRAPQEVYVSPDDFMYGKRALERFRLKLDVDREGRVHGIQIIASDDPMLNDSVMRAVQHISWRPARLNHHDITAPVDLTVLLHSYTVAGS